MDIKGKEWYWCSQCNKVHKRYRKSDGKKIKIFFDHAQYAQHKTLQEVQMLQFKKRWKELAKEQKRTGKPLNEPKKGKRKQGG
ncbi:MAG: hypothetical protein ABIB46_06260 [bacterium]